jgi:N12 class adenine-specific DNA methylase
MVLGVQGATSGMYGAGYTVAMPNGGRESVVATLVERMRTLPPGLLTPAPPSIATTAGLGLGLVNDGAALTESAQAVLEPQRSPTQAVRVPALLAVRDAARTALRAQLDGAAPQTIHESQRRLNAAYDQFVFRYGPLNAHANVAAMGTDPDAFFLRALERWDTETQQRHKTGRPVAEAAARQRLKMPLFHDIVVRQARPAISARSVRDAYLITLNERGALDFGRMAELLGPGGSQNENAVRHALASDGLIFDDPEGGWQAADAYLSGDVKTEAPGRHSSGACRAPLPTER